jgi:tetratricopeptide (TPR) repeat protein
MAAYQGADYKRSYALFKQAYELRQVGALLYNMGKSQDKLGNVKEALELYRRYRDSTDADANLIAKVTNRIKALEAAERLARQSAEAARTPPDSEDVIAPMSRRAFSKAEMVARARRRDERIAAWTLFGVAMASGAVAIGVGSTAQSVRAQLLANAQLEATQDELAQRSHRFGVAADGMIALAAASIVTSGVLLYLGYREVPGGKRASLRLVPIGLGGTF